MHAEEALPNPSSSQPEVMCMPEASHRTKRRGENMFLEHDRCEPSSDCPGVVSTAGWGIFVVQEPAKEHRKDEPGRDVHNEVYEHHHA